MTSLGVPSPPPPWTCAGPVAGPPQPGAERRRPPRPNYSIDYPTIFAVAMVIFAFLPRRQNFATADGLRRLPTPEVVTLVADKGKGQVSV